MSEPVVFDQAFEALFVRALGDKLSPDLKAKLVALGVDLDKLQVAYPPETWVHAVELACRTVYPQLSADEGHFLLGQEFIKGLSKTFGGKALFALGKVLGPRKMLDRMTRNFRSSNNYLESTLTAPAEGSLRLVARVDPSMKASFVGKPQVNPHYIRGILHGAISEGGARNVSVEMVEAKLDEREYHYDIRMDV